MKEVMKYGIIVLAGGSGTRMGSVKHKQYMDIAGVPIIVRTLARVEQTTIPLEVVVVHDGDDSLYHDYIHVRGGASRAESVWHGLQAFQGEHCVDRVAIHDGVRPFFDTNTLEKMLLSDEFALLPARTSVESVRIMTGDYPDQNENIVRDNVKLVQTPQVFDYELVYRAYQRFFEDKEGQLPFTDDASIVEALMGVKPVIVPGSELNIKITTPKDLALAEWIVSMEEHN